METGRSGLSFNVKGIINQSQVFRIIDWRSGDDVEEERAEKRSSKHKDSRGANHFDVGNVIGHGAISRWKFAIK